MGLHFSITDLVDATDAVVDSAQKAGGKVIQKGSHLVGGALDEAGLHGVAQKVNGWGDDVADGAGLKVGERGLDQSDDPKELVHGDAKKLGEVAGHLKKFHDAFEKTGTGLARLDHEHWTGAAAEAFQKAFDPQPKQWLTAADACGKAAAALEAYAHTVTWAQGEAAEAARLWKAAKKKADAAAKAWREDAMTYNLRVKAYNSTPADQRPAAPPTDPGEFKNPAEADFRHAEEKLDAARTQRDSAARTAAGAIGAAVASAPAMPSKMQILKAEVKDGLMAAPVAYEHFYGGLIKSGTDLAKLGRSLNPMDPYNLSHPAQYLDGLSTTTAGLIKAGDHPVDLLKGLVGSGWGNDPSEASGKLVGNFLIGAGTGGGGTAATLAEREAAAVAENAAKKAAQEAAEKTAKEATELAAKDSAVATKLRDLMDLEARSTSAWPSDPLKVAATKDVNLTNMAYEPKWRTTNEDLYRFDARNPEKIFKPDGGLQPWESDFNDLHAYASGESKSSIFVGTTRDPGSRISMGRQWRYDIEAEGGIDVNATLGRKESGGITPYADEAEVAFPGGVRVENIKGAWRLENGTPVEFVPNPYYKPGPASHLPEGRTNP
ncbi:hypothetical protein J5Y04_16400 [Kitasatospora sp. RG8]|uniref:putative T7SS-secreted protein n=1 Tax=Kitasatospora sp. RG8 TaxID=2820815 RepID=UPI001ADEDE66|nr:hypothetical protein [Kitasatospora sp. RG8]MBP0451112.1 hypothetical protein [Kitasatospora sp. RG8]